MDEVQIPGFFTALDKDGDLAYIKASEVRILEEMHDERCKSCVSFTGGSRWLVATVSEIAQKIAAAINAEK